MEMGFPLASRDRCMMEDCVIIGGGIAALSAANQLADAGLKPLLIEANSYPAHRICGEFISPECHPTLNNWNIALSSSMTNCRFIQGSDQMEFTLPKPAKSCSRYHFDTQLLERAKSKGAQILTNTKMISLQKTSDYELTLSNGQTIKARHLMIGTGKLPNMSTQMPLKYIGMKAHFTGIDLQNTLEMHLFPGGYLGISPIDHETTNIACLLRLDRFPQFNPEIFIKSLPSLNKKLSQAKMLFPKWLVGQVPEFGIRKNPHWDKAFWIGDAAGSIPPISGEGLALAVFSGCMAADYLLKSDSTQFQQDWLAQVKKRFIYAKLLHKTMLNPFTSKIAIKIGNLFPSTPQYFWGATRG